MSRQIKALVVEDDPNIREEIEDVLVVLGHEFAWAESQQEAREFLELNDCDYALVDLEIPARTGRGFPRVEYGRTLIEQIPQLKGRGRIPVVVMTAHHMEGLNLARDLLGNGAMDFVSKPFGDGSRGKSLAQVVQKVLDQHRHAYPPGTLPADPPQPFRGGTLGFYPAQIELNGCILVEDDGSGHAWSVLQVLRTPRATGKLPHLSAPKLAKAVDPTGQLSEGAVASCIHDLRERISNRMLEEANVVVGRDHVIANLGRGYHLAKWLRIESHDGPAAAEAGAAAVGVRGSALTVCQPADGPEAAADRALSERQAWALEQVKAGVRLTRRMVQKQFGIGEKQAKRELAALTGAGTIRFVRLPRPGYYVLQR